MKKRPIFLLILVVFLLGSCNRRNTDESTKWNPQIIEGHWQQEGDNATDVETWQVKSDSVCVGLGYVLVRGDTVTVERMEMVKNHGTWSFGAQVSNNSPKIRYTCVSESPNELVFENDSYSYPQKIIYQWGTLVQLRVFLIGEVDGQFKRRILVYLKEEGQN